MHQRILSAALLLPLLAAAPAQGQELRIGFLATLSGSGGILGQEQLNGFRIGLAHEGWKQDGDKVAGVPTKLFVADDQQKTDIGLRETQRLIQSEKVQVFAGFTFSNVLMAVQKTMVDSERVMLASLAAASPMAGAACSVFYTATSAQTSQWGETVGKLMTDDGVKRVFAMAPNYQAGKDTIAGFRRFYTGGTVVGETLFKLGENDFQAEISRLRAENPDAVYIFAPGAMGISFIKQWAASGAGKTIRVYTVGVMDELTLPAMGNAAAGTVYTTNWDSGSANAVNRTFIKDYAAQFGRKPSFYAAQAYDSARLLAAAVRKVGGKVDEALALARAVRRTPFPSVRDRFKLNVNGIPIQSWFKAQVALGPDGKAELLIAQAIVHELMDSYWSECPQARRY